jgi:hypothetical protein
LTIVEAKLAKELVLRWLLGHGRTTGHGCLGQMLNTVNGSGFDKVNPFGQKVIQFFIQIFVKRTETIKN